MSKPQPRVCPPKLLLMSMHPVGEEIDKDDPFTAKRYSRLGERRKNAQNCSL